MTKTLYYVEIECIKDIEFPNVSYKAGDILYYNTKASSNETYMYNYRNEYNNKDIIDRYVGIFTCNYHLPFVRKKTNARKWQVRSYAEYAARQLNYEKRTEFKAVVKEIKLTYTEEA